MATVRYTVIDGEVIAEKRNGVRRLYVPDPLGSTVALIDNTQTITDRFSYWPYGEEASRTGTTPTPLRYRGTLGMYQGGDGRVYAPGGVYRSDLAGWCEAGDEAWPANLSGSEPPGAACALAEPTALGEPKPVPPPPPPNPGMCPKGTTFVRTCFLVARVAGTLAGCVASPRTRYGDALCGNLNGGFGLTLAPDCPKCTAQGLVLGGRVTGTLPVNQTYTKSVLGTTCVCTLTGFMTATLAACCRKKKAGKPTPGPKPGRRTGGCGCRVA